MFVKVRQKTKVKYKKAEEKQSFAFWDIRIENL